MLDTNKIQMMINDSLLKVYSFMLKDKSYKEDYINVFWKLIEDSYAYTIGYIKDKIPETKDIYLDIMTLLYDDKDEKRIELYFDEFNISNKSILDRNKFLNNLSLIFNTEAKRVKDESFLKIGEELIKIPPKENDNKIYYYEVWACFEDSECGEIGGEEKTEEVKYTWKPINSEHPDSGINICDHPGCKGHIVDIEYRLKEVIENV